MTTLILGTGSGTAAHAAHAALIIIGGLIALILVWRLTRALSRVSRIPAPVATAPRPAGRARALGVTGLILLFGYIYEKTRHTPAATAVHAPAPAPSPSPSARVITHTITRTVASHPLLSGWQIVALIVVIAIAVMGTCSIVLRRAS